VHQAGESGGQEFEFLGARRLNRRRLTWGRYGDELKRPTFHPKTCGR
jgi:hypothetical protein